MSRSNRSKTAGKPVPDRSAPASSSCAALAILRQRKGDRVRLCDLPVDQEILGDHLGTASPESAREPAERISVRAPAEGSTGSDPAGTRGREHEIGRRAAMIRGHRLRQHQTFQRRRASAAASAHRDDVVSQCPAAKGARRGLSPVFSPDSRAIHFSFVGIPDGKTAAGRGRAGRGGKAEPELVGLLRLTPQRNAGE